MSPPLLPPPAHTAWSRTATSDHTAWSRSATSIRSRTGTSPLPRRQSKNATRRWERSGHRSPRDAVEGAWENKRQERGFRSAAQAPRGIGEHGGRSLCPVGTASRGQMDRGFRDAAQAPRGTGEEKGIGRSAQEGLPLVANGSCDSTGKQGNRALCPVGTASRGQMVHGTRWELPAFLAKRYVGCDHGMRSWDAFVGCNRGTRSWDAIVGDCAQILSVKHAGGSQRMWGWAGGESTGRGIPRKRQTRNIVTFATFAKQQRSQVQ